MTGGNPLDLTEAAVVGDTVYTDALPTNASITFYRIVAANAAGDATE